MPSIESIIRGINKELIPQFEEKLRSYLVQQDKEWLIEQIIRLSLDAHSLEEMDRKTLNDFKARKRAERAARVREMAFDEPGLVAFLAHYESYDQKKLVAEGYLINDLPLRGAEIIPSSCRSEKGEALLTTAKD